jgi:hypothetical protein
MISSSQRPLPDNTHNTHNRQTSIPPVEFEPAIPVGERPHTYTLGRVTTGTGRRDYNDGTKPWIALAIVYLTVLNHSCLFHDSVSIFKMRGSSNVIVNSNQQYGKNVTVRGRAKFLSHHAGIIQEEIRVNFLIPSSWYLVFSLKTATRILSNMTQYSYVRYLRLSDAHIAWHFTSVLLYKNLWAIQWLGYGRDGPMFELRQEQ